LDIEVIFNQFEAALWFAISAVLFWAWLKTKPRRFHWSLVVAFAVFGVSDVIESYTGAWWDPWWLFVMKAACVLVFLRAWVVYRKSRRKR
jgi:hypothetical protein